MVPREPGPTPIPRPALRTRPHRWSPQAGSDGVCIAQGSKGQLPPWGYKCYKKKPEGGDAGGGAAAAGHGGAGDAGAWMPAS